MFRLKLLLCLNLICSPLLTHTFAASYTDEHTTQELSTYDMQQQLLSQLHKHCSNARHIIQMLGAEIVTARVQPLNPSQVLQQLRACDQKIIHVQQEIPTSLEDQWLHHKFLELQHYIDLLASFIAQQGKSFGQPQPSHFVEMSLPALQQQSQLQEKQLQHISQQIPLLGLNKLQRTYKKGIDFLQERGFGTQTLLAAGAASTLFTLFLYSMKQADFDIIANSRGMRYMPFMPLLRMYKRMLGEPYSEVTVQDLARMFPARQTPPQQATAGNTIVPPTGMSAHPAIPQPTLLAALHRVADKTLGFSTVAIAPFLWRTSIQTWMQNATEKMQNAILVQHHKMMGNTYRPTGIQRYIESGFEEVVGNQELKHALKILAEYVCMPEKFARTRSVPSKFMLITGKTGAGKSFIVQQFAGYINQRLMQLGKTYRVPFIELKPKDIWQAKAEFGDLRAYFSAKIPGPAIVFIDEIGLLGLHKTGDKELLNQFLTLMSGFEHNHTKSQVILIAATNNPQDLDPALLREGRFGTPFNIEYPVAQQRYEFILKELRKAHITLTTEYINYLVQQTDGQTFEMIRNIIHTPLRESAMRNIPVTPDMFDHAINVLLFGIKPVRQALSETQSQMLAIKIAGQLVATKVLSPHLKIARATIAPISKTIKMSSSLWLDVKDHKDKPSQSFGNVFTYTATDKTGFQQSSSLRSHIQQLLAGTMAQRLILGDHSIAKEDPVRNNAYDLCIQLVSQGLDLEHVANKVKDEISVQAYTLLHTLEQETESLMQQHKELIQLLAEHLMQRTTLQEQEITVLLNQSSLNAAHNALA